MSFIANIAFEKNGGYKSFGSIWYSDKLHAAALLLKGFRFGQFFAMPFDQVKAPPYLEGDILIHCGYNERLCEREYLWCGWIWTCSDQRGVVYNGVLEVDPMPIILQRELKETDKDIVGNKSGVMLGIKLVDGGN